MTLNSATKALYALFVRTSSVTILVILLANALGVSSEPVLKKLAEVRFNKVRYSRPSGARDLLLEKAIGDYYSFGPGYELGYIYNEVKLAKGKRHVLACIKLSKGPRSDGSGDVLMLFSRLKNGGYKLEQLFADAILPVLISDKSTRGHHDIVYRSRAPGSESSEEYRVFQFSPEGYPGWPDSLPLRKATVSGVCVLAGQGRDSDGFHKFKL